VKTDLVGFSCLRGKQYRDFSVVRFGLDPSDDSGLIAAAVEDAEQMRAVNLDPSGAPKSSAKVMHTRYLGAISERLLAKYLGQALDGVATVEREAEYLGHDDHVDLRIGAADSSLELEVRGSFPYSKMERVLCELFDVIGPYSTGFKPEERPKDLYLRTLINCKQKFFTWKKPHEVWFVGGAPRDLFYGELAHEDNFDQDGARYRAIKPIAAALDVPEVVEWIKSQFEAAGGAR